MSDGGGGGNCGGLMWVKEVKGIWKCFKKVTPPSPLLVYQYRKTAFANSSIYNWWYWLIDFSLSLSQHKWLLLSKTDLGDICKSFKMPVMIIPDGFSERLDESLNSKEVWELGVSSISPGDGVNGHGILPFVRLQHTWEKHYQTPHHKSNLATWLVYNIGWTVNAHWKDIYFCFLGGFLERYICITNS